MMKKCLGIFLCVMLFGTSACAKGEPQELYALSAVLMDADTGRILYEKNGREQRPMASTTKIMTLLVTLENADLEGTVEVSDYAASMPDVQLNMRAGEKYRLRDLCYSLMLESHNDTAVAIAEHVGGSVEGFASMMNQKARDLGCTHTYFITPNGLDASDEKGIHSTTAEDLARIRSVTVNNKNAFLNMMEGALTGKTGFTNGAGYCYVGVLERGEKRLIAVVLACGWPNHKTWKWADTMKLMNYGLDEFHIQTIGEDTIDLGTIQVADGQIESVEAMADVNSRQMLMQDGDTFRMDIKKPETLTAPVEAGEIVGTVLYYMNDEIIDLFPIYAKDSSPSIDFAWCFEKVVKKWITVL